MATNITDRQRAVLAFVIAYIRDHGYPPSLREIGAALKIRSTNGVSDHLSALARKGYIEMGNTKARAIRVTLPSGVVVAPLDGDGATEHPAACGAGDVATIDEARAVLTLIESTATLPQGVTEIDLVRRLARGLLAQSERRSRVSTADGAAIVERYVVQRKSVSVIARAFGVSDRTVRSELARSGVRMRRPGRPTGSVTREAA